MNSIFNYFLLISVVSNITNPLSIIIYPIGFLILQIINPLLIKLKILNILFSLNNDHYHRIYVYIMINLLYFIIIVSLSIKNFIEKKTLNIKNILIKNYLIPIFILNFINFIHNIYENITIKNINHIDNIGNISAINFLTSYIIIGLILTTNYYFFIKWFKQKQSYIKVISSITLINLVSMTFYILLILIFSYFSTFFNKFIN